MKILVVGSPKGGVGKSTTAATLAVIAAKRWGLRVLLIDADNNRSILDWLKKSDDKKVPIEIADGTVDLSLLSKLRQTRSGTCDLIIVDLPGAHEGAFKASIEGNDGKPGADLLLAPTEHEVIAVTPVQRVIRNEVMPLGLPHMVVITRVDPQALGRADEYRRQLRDFGLSVANSTIRSYVAYRDARERRCTILDVGGSHSYARLAEADYVALAGEVFSTLHLKPATTSNGEK